jgi:hypothetical protein
MRRGSSWHDTRRRSFPGLGFGIAALVASAAAGIGWMHPGWSTVAAHEVKLLASTAAANDRFGSSVAIDGDTAVVGAPRVDDRGVDSGLAYAFRRDGTGWVEEAQLAASDGTASDRFGNSVALDGSTALVGAALDDDVGSTHVFERDEVGWIEKARLVASDGAPGDGFGASAAMDGDTAVVGAPLDDGRGSAYVFRDGGGGWIEEARLVASDRAPGDRFGDSVAVSGDAVVVGAWSDRPRDSRFFTGSAYVFRYEGGGWVEDAKLTASDGSGGDAFGRSVALAGDIVVVGTPKGEDEGGVETGSVYVFRHDGRSWVEDAKLTASDRVMGGFFGISVAIDGDTIIVGADAAATGGKPPQSDRPGSAYVFGYDGGAWVETLKLTAFDSAVGNRFGSAVAIAADAAVIGAPLDDSYASNAGSAYVFAVPEPSVRLLHASSIAWLAFLARRARAGRQRATLPSLPGDGVAPSGGVARAR